MRQRDLSGWFRWIKFLLWKEFFVVLKDKRSRFILIVPLFVQVFLFAYATTFDLKKVESPLRSYQ